MILNKQYVNPKPSSKWKRVTSEKKKKTLAATMTLWKIPYKVLLTTNFKIYQHLFKLYFTIEDICFYKIIKYYFNPNHIYLSAGTSGIKMIIVPGQTTWISKATLHSDVQLFSFTAQQITIPAWGGTVETFNWRAIWAGGKH